MIVKDRDARPELIKALELQARNTSDNVKRSACKSAVSRLLADQTTAFATDQIDVQFSQSDDWAVIHDLRLRIAGHAIQINHLLISSALNFFCLDTRFIDYGLDLNSNGKCHVFDRHERKPVASPLTKAAKDARKLAELAKQEGWSTTQFGIERKVSVRAFVLTNPALRLGLAGKFDNTNIGVHPSSALFQLLWKTGFSNTGLRARRLSADALRDVAETVVSMHTPVYSPSLLKSDSLATETTRQLLAKAA